MKKNLVLLVLVLLLFATSVRADSTSTALTVATPDSSKALAVDQLTEPTPDGKLRYIERIAREPRRIKVPEMLKATMRVTPSTPQPAIAPTQTPGGPTATPSVWGWCRLCACLTNSASIYWSTSVSVTTTTGEELPPGACVSNIPATDYTCGSVNIVAATASLCYTLTMEP